ncbi:hypothetical protein [Pseudoruegeria sp. HB172150]|nr:hypothetical protein [Pseudoruegeria sp. HB172150]
MKAMLTGFAAIVVIAIGAHFVLEALDFSSENSNSAASVRID